MQIESIKITKQEHIEAVSQWLKGKGLDVTITSIDTHGYPVKGWLIECEPIEDVAPPITSVEDLGAAIEAGKV